MNRKVFVFVLALLAGIVLLAGQSAVSASEGDTDWWYFGDVEPNDTPAQAISVFYNNIPAKIGGEVGVSDQWDYYQFDGTGGDGIGLPTSEHHWYDCYWWGSGCWSIVLLDPDLNPILLEGEIRFAILPVSGTYTIGVTPDPAADGEVPYGFYLINVEGDEPNNSLSTATPVEALSSVTAVYDYPCDVDYYVFQGHKGDIFPIYHNHEYANGSLYWSRGDYALYDADGNYMFRVYVLPADGTYYLRAQGIGMTEDENWCLEGAYSLTIGYPLWVSAAQNSLGGNTAIKAQDIAMRANAPGKWQLVFDASDVGITKNINAIERLDDGSILMSLFGPQTVKDVGKVMPQDIIRFYPTSLGNTTAGTFEMYLDGSDVGLTTSGENIDAIHFKPWWDDPNPLAISVTGNGSVPKQGGGTLNFRDEDLINFVGTSYGANSAGAWRLDLDGSTVAGLAAEDISASTFISLYPLRTSRLLVAFNSAFNIEGATGKPRDVVDLDIDDRQPDDPYLLSYVAARNLTDKTIDAMTMGAALSP